jgi:hypothetical protein
LTVVKRSPDGAEAARYSGDVIARFDPGCWVVVRAIWTYHTVELDGLAFIPGDVLHEWFSPEHFFNVFAISRPDGSFAGWYANVTYPAWLDETAATPVLIWHDLYVDLVGLPDGSFTIRDDDELGASGLQHRDPKLYACILGARGALIERFRQRRLPFAESLSVIS